MKLSVSAYRAHASAHKKILSNSYQSQYNYGSTAASSSSAPTNLLPIELIDSPNSFPQNCDKDSVILDLEKSQFDEDSENKNKEDNNTDSSGSRKTVSNMGEEDGDQFNVDWSKSNQRWMKLRTTVQISSAIQKKPPLKREDSFLKRFSTRQIPETQETLEDSTTENSITGKITKRRRRYFQKHHLVVNPDENFYFYWLMMITCCVLYNLWTLIVRQSFPELQELIPRVWVALDSFTDIVFIFDIVVQLRTGYLEQGLMVYDGKKLACHYARSKNFIFDTLALMPLDLLQLKFGFQPLIRFPRFLKVYRSVRFYYIVESRTVWPNLWRVVNLIHVLLILAHWFGCFYYLLSEAEGFQGDWVYPYRPGDYATLTRKYLGSLYWSTLTLTTIGDLPTPETNAENRNAVDGPRPLPRRGIKSRLLIFATSRGYLFTIVSYLIGVFIFATIVGQVGNVITNRNANRLEFERLLDGAKTYMRHHKVPGGMKRRVLRWYDYSWSRGRIQGGGDINTALGLLPDKLKTELALHVNLSVLKKVTIFQECQPEFLHDLVLKMKAYIFTPGDSICRKGEVAREMFIIADGILEVLSETGKVLTTMKAGDFFGEIGILNLDGLNKRTADVRSVGYSELFSLSREDVLAAMKDYPEAQTILQTLGRKRLMEVRGANKKHAEEESKKLEKQHESATSAAKSIVEKFKNEDIKGKIKNIKGVLKKTRRSAETMELKPLFTSIPESNNAMNPNRGFLKRMSQVKSIETSKDSDERSMEKASSPIGAGLPLLQRLKLLKEKQDREEQIVQNKTIHIRRISREREPKDDNFTIKEDVSKEAMIESLESTSKDFQKLATSTSPITNNNNEALNIPGTPRKVSFSKVDNKNEITTNENLKTESDKNNLCEPSNKSPTKTFLSNTNINKPSKSSWSKLSTTFTAPASTTSKSKINIENHLDNKIPLAEAKKTNVIEKLENTEKPKLINLNILNNNNSTIKSDLSEDHQNQLSKNNEKGSENLKFNEKLSVDVKSSLIQIKSFEYESTIKSIKTISLMRSRSESSLCELKNIFKSDYDFLFNKDNDNYLHSPGSPESNETIERRKLKSLLKRMHLSKQYFKSNQPNKLMREPTIEGYVARHSKLMKSVTLNSTLSSPPFYDKKPSQSEQKKFFLKQNGSVEKRNEVQEAVNNMITKHIQEMYNFYQTKFYELQFEIEKRDRKINELEFKLNKCNDFSFENCSIKTQPSYNSADNDKYFSKNFRMEQKCYKQEEFMKKLPEYCQFKQSKNSSENDYLSNQEQYRQSSDSVFLKNKKDSWSDGKEEADINELYESSSSSSIESLQSNQNDSNNTNSQSKQSNSQKTNDWEIRMLADELDQRERKRGKSLSGNLTQPVSQTFRNQMNISDSDTEFSDNDIEKNNPRPRAISLDQFNFGDRSSILLKKMRLSKGRKRL